MNNNALRKKNEVRTLIRLNITSLEPVRVMFSAYTQVCGAQIRLALVQFFKMLILDNVPCFDDPFSASTHY